MADFIGRQKELEKLHLLWRKKTASLVVIKGRRRIGKSRLVEEFSKNHTLYAFSGVVPAEKTTLKDQLNEFGWQLGKAFGVLPILGDDWNDLFLQLARRTQKGRVIILLDEITWMGSKDPNFLGKLKNAWDLEFKKNPELILILCGSVSAWIEDNILSKTGFAGRISLNLTVDELSLSQCNQFWIGVGNHITAYEKFKILSITGGIPKYLEEIHPGLSAQENIKNLCFDRSGLLFNEFEQIFSAIFSKRHKIYKRIVESIAEKKYEGKDIYSLLNIEKSGVMSEYLDELIKSGFIRRDYTWNLKTGKVSKFSHYRISDNYLRFYLKYISPNKEKIERDSFLNQSLILLPAWESIMGLQFENLVLNNREKIIELLGIQSNDITYDNPFFQKKTLRQEGCQIDYLIQTRFDVLYVCEIKFSKYPIKLDIIKEMQKKISRLKTPPHLSRLPVLIHVNGVEEAIRESRYFSNIIDFTQLLEKAY